MLEIDGSHGEGGGQLIRSALAFSVLTKTPFKAVNIRKGRETPGLKAQHMHCVKALQQLCDAKAEGAEIGSTTLEFSPGKIEAKDLTIDIGTAGSITLLLQAVLLPCCFGEKEITLTVKGGTDTRWSMPIDYFIELLIPYYQKIADIEAVKVKRGYYPKGGGILKIHIKPKFEEYKEAAKCGFDIIELGKIEKIEGISNASSELKKARVAERQAEAAEKALKDLGIPVEITTEYENTSSKGTGIVLWAKNGEIKIGADSLGKIGVKSEEVGEAAANNLKSEIAMEAPIDSHLADNLIPLLAVCKGKIKVTEITDHTKTNMFVVEQFLGKKFKIEGNVISTINA